MRRRGTRLTACAAGACALLGALAAPAAANFHLMKIREVYPGSVAAANSDFVVLQMTAPGQSQVENHEITLYDAGGSLTTTITMDDNVSAGADQSTILIGGSGYAAAFPAVPADFSDATLNLSPAGGAVCFPDGVPADCVSWGTFTPPGSGYPSTSTPNASPSGITNGMALRRSIAAGCPTMLESGDDTNSSVADLVEVAPAPRSNATPPTERPCLPPPPPTPNTTITGGPKGKVRDRTPTFRFRSNLAGSTFRCKLDRKAFKACSSPKAFGRLGFGSHTFRVKAINDGRTDPTPAKRSFRVVRPR